MQKNYLTSAVLLLVLVLSFSACTNTIPTTDTTTDAAQILTEVKTTQFFTDAPAEHADMEKLLSAGVNAPSAMNTQPWHFTIISVISVMTNSPF